MERADIIDIIQGADERDSGPLSDLELLERLGPYFAAYLRELEARYDATDDGGLYFYLCEYEELLNELMRRHALRSGVNLGLDHPFFPGL